jgi:hypothetical protein
MLRLLGNYALVESVRHCTVCEVPSLAFEFSGFLGIVVFQGLFLFSTILHSLVLSQCTLHSHYHALHHFPFCS